MRVIFLLMLMIIASNHALAEDRKCLDGFELTAIVVLETDIRQSVEAFACRMAFPKDSSTYDLYTQLREKWKQPRDEQRAMRDRVYQRIYGDAWQQKVDDWTQAMAVDYGKSFRPGDITCHDLRNEMGVHASDWETLYNSAAREAASARYDSLRCESPTVIQFN
jgi:hypothetical protein